MMILINGIDLNTSIIDKFPILSDSFYKIFLAFFHKVHLILSTFDINYVTQAADFLYVV